ncbi:GNAT family N-acetyltransferase [Desulfitobacterium chlororespirans]|nr:GNAT family N-acetyltransferase [Desulfitobacterium chlororespirans]
MLFKLVTHPRSEAYRRDIFFHARKSGIIDAVLVLITTIQTNKNLKTKDRVIMELIVKRFEELTAEELYEILKIRVAVFVVEQNCPYQEIDGKDKQSFHIYLKDDCGIQAYLRVVDKGVSFNEVSIGRVIAVKRRCGIGSRILSEGVKVAKNRLGAAAIKIEAQTYAKEFYEQQGFKQVSEEFLEDGIPHIQMILDVI